MYKLNANDVVVFLLNNYFLFYLLKCVFYDKL